MYITGTFSGSESGAIPELSRNRDEMTISQSGPAGKKLTRTGLLRNAVQGARYTDQFA